MTVGRNFQSTKSCISNYDMLLRIFSSTDVVTLQRLTHVCRYWSLLGRILLRHRVDSELKWHITPTTESSFSSNNPQRDCIDQFLQLLADTNSVISGSTPLAICVQGTPRAGSWMDERDLDIFAPAYRADTVVEYLNQQLGYTVVFQLHYSTWDTESEIQDTREELNRDAPSYMVCNPLVNGIVGLTRLGTPDGRRIDVIESLSDCALLPIVHFPFTHLINFITATTIVVCYPRQTLISGSGLPNPDNRHGQRLRDRYVSRGWTLSDVFTHTQHCRVRSSYCPLLSRNSGDSLCFSFAFCGRDAESARRSVAYMPGVRWLWGSYGTHNCVDTIPGHEDASRSASYGHFV